MTENTPGSDARETHRPRAGYYMLSGDPDGGAEVTLLGLWDVVWSQKLLIIAICSLFAIGSIVVALLMEPIYRSDSVLAPVDGDEMPDVASRLGGLASLAGLRMGGSSDGTNAVAILRSREFAAAFIAEKDLLPLFYEDMWDAEAGKWLVEDASEIPQMYDAVKLFHDYVFSVKEDPVSGLVSIAVEWKDPEVAAQWVNTIVERINRETRARALREAEANLAYLQTQLETASVVELRSAISRIIETELKTIMIANAREQYAFSVIDPGMVPTKKVRPRRGLIVVATTFLGGLFALAVAFLRHTLRHQVGQRNQAGSPTAGAG